MAEYTPYAWLGAFLASLKAYSNAEATWMEHPMSQAIWQVVNEEIHVQEQGRQFIPTANPTGQPRSERLGEGFSL